MSHTASHMAGQTVQAAGHTVRSAWRPRYFAHFGLLALAATLIVANSQPAAHTVSVRLASTRAGLGAQLDPSTTATLAAQIAQTNQLVVAAPAALTAVTAGEQVDLLTSDDMTLAKRQVVATAGNPTRDITTYTVQAGDNLSKISKHFYGDPNQYMKIVNANKETLPDPDKIKPGMQLNIP